MVLLARMGVLATARVVLARRADRHSVAANHTYFRGFTTAGGSIV
jgi:hypothetical protein